MGIFQLNCNGKGMWTLSCIEQSAEFECRQNAFQNTNLLHPNPCKNVTEISCAQRDDVEFEWLGEAV